MLFIVWGALAIVAAISMATSCTLSYQNIRTHGTTSDVDENQTATPSVQVKTTANLSALPTPLIKVPEASK